VVGAAVDVEPEGTVPAGSVPAGSVPTGCVRSAALFDVLVHPRIS
jgi:hypothetical protein